MNVVLMRGTISREPEIRALPSGGELLSFDLTTRVGDEAATSAPIVWFEPPPTSSSFGAGDDVVVIGQVRRRWFRSAGTTQSRTEVVAQRVLPARQAKRVRAATDHAIGRVLAALG